MFIRIDHAPHDVTEQEIMNLFNSSPRIKHVIIKNEQLTKDSIVWVRLNIDSRAVINGIADYLNDRYIRGFNIKVSAPLFFNEPWIQDS